MPERRQVTVSHYDIVASAMAAEGGGPPHTDQFLVLNNNDNYFLVVMRDVDAPLAFVIAAFQYTELDTVRVYRLALAAMVDVALSY